MEMMRNDKFPFTSTQWQELEHQALVYKYMISGMPIPPDLLFSIQRSLDSSAKLFLHHHSAHHSIGRDYFQMGYGRKIDPEPGRCRRTDGKKWRCSKEVFPDSKYCERHMHRGRNRSRKPVEALLSTPPQNTPPPLSISCTKSPNKLSSKSHSPFGYAQLSSSSSSRSCGGNVLSSRDRFSLESSPYSLSEKDHSYGMKEDEHEHPYIVESCGGGTWNLEPLSMKNSSLTPSRQRSFSDFQNENYSYQNSPTQKQQKQNCYDQLALKIESKDEPQKVMHHFFDESPHDDDNHDHNKDKDSSTTQLSISIPDRARDFFHAHNDK